MSGEGEANGGRRDVFDLNTSLVHWTNSDNIRSRGHRKGSLCGGIRFACFPIHLPPAPPPFPPSLSLPSFSSLPFLIISPSPLPSFSFPALSGSLSPPLSFVSVAPLSTNRTRTVVAVAQPVGVTRLMSERAMGEVEQNASRPLHLSSSDAFSSKLDLSSLPSQSLNPSLPIPI